MKLVWKVLTAKEFYIFMDIMVYTGVVQVHHRSDYWRKGMAIQLSLPW